MRFGQISFKYWNSRSRERQNVNVFLESLRFRYGSPYIVGSGR